MKVQSNWKIISILSQSTQISCVWRSCSCLKSRDEAAVGKSVIKKVAMGPTNYFYFKKLQRSIVIAVAGSQIMV